MLDIQKLHLHEDSSNFFSFGVVKAKLKNINKIPDFSLLQMKYILLVWENTAGTDALRTYQTIKINPRKLYRQEPVSLKPG